MSKHSIQRRDNARGSFDRLAQAFQFIAHMRLRPQHKAGLAVIHRNGHQQTSGRHHFTTKPTDRCPATIPLATVELEYPFVQDLSKSLCHDPKFPGEHPTRHRTNETPQDAMNLQDVYERLGSNITQANDGDRIENHGYEIHVSNRMDNNLAKHFGQVCRLLRETEAAGMTYSGYFSEDAIVGISKLDGFIKIEHLQVRRNETAF
ncbi:hypothetical protein RB213_007021 [Colletotrichum asianum]